MLIALDGTEYFCSRKLGCPQCLTRKRSNGKIESYHSRLCATVVAPGHAMALPLTPDFIALQDGAEKQDRERNAVKRWLATHGERVDDLRPHLPRRRPVRLPAGRRRHGGGGRRRPAHRQADIAQRPLRPHRRRHAAEERVLEHKVAGRTLTYRHRWFNRVPLRDGTDARLVDWVGVTITDAKGKVAYQSAFVTSLDVTRDSVAEIVACARARWKIENESFDVLKSDGYHLEHDFGHGKQSLAMMFAALNMLAFAVHTVCDCLERIWVDARTAKRARHRFFEHVRTITARLVFPDWNTPHADPHRLQTHHSKSKLKSHAEMTKGGPSRIAGRGAP